MDYEMMEAGPEMDALVAEEVMEWFLPRDINLGGPHWVYAGSAWMRKPDESPNKQQGVWAGYLAVEPTWHDGEYYEQIQEPMAMLGTERWAPSRNMAHTWEVVEKMAGKTVGYHINIALDESASVSIGTARFHGKREEIPLLICRAALMAADATSSSGAVPTE